MTRRVLTIAASAAALFITTNAFADETAPSETVEQPMAETPAAVEPAPAPVPVIAPAPAPAPVVLAAPPPPAPVVAPVMAAPRFAPMAMQQDRPLEAAKTEKEKDENFRIGGMLGVGFPRPFAVEGFVKVKKYVGVGFEYSFLPDSTVAGVDIAFKGMAADLRVFPFAGGFFVGVRGGKQWLSTRTTINATISGLPPGANVGGKYNESMNADTLFVNPRIGYLKTWDSGITIGIDAGVQVPINPNYERDSDSARAGVKTDADTILLSVANTLGNKATPTIDLLRIGFLF